MANQGWIKLHRKLLESPIFKDALAFQLWVYILLKANHKDGNCLIGNTMVDIKRGELLTGRKSLSEATGLNESKVRRLLKLFENSEKVTIKKTTKYSIISIVNYSDYQESDQQPTNNRPTTDQQPTTNKNVKNEENVKKIDVKRFSPPTLAELQDYCKEKNYIIDADRFINFYESKGWYVGKNKMKSWRAAVNNWSKPKQEEINQTAPISKPLSNGRI
jgi:hypothetical protein